MKTKTLGVVFVLMIALLIVNVSAFIAEAQDVVELTVWMGSWWKDQAPKLEEAFNAAHPNMKVKIEPIPISGYLDKAVATILGGSPPDVLALDAIMIASVVGKELLLPLDEYIKDVDVSDFFPGMWSAGVYDGKVYAISHRSGSGAFFYNKTLFDDAGLAYPTEDWTYADMLETAKKLTIPGKQYGFGLSATPNDPANVMGQIGPVVWAFGGDILDKDNKTCVLNQPDAVKGLEFWSDLYTRHKVTPEGAINYSNNDNMELFIAGKLAMFTHGTSPIKRLGESPDLQWGLQLYPDKFNRGGGWALSVPSNAKHPEEALKYILWFTEAKNLSKLTIRMPGRAAATTAPPWNNDIYKVYLKSAEYAKLLPIVPQWSEIQTVIIREMQKVLEGKMTAQEAADSITKQANALLKE